MAWRLAAVLAALVIAASARAQHAPPGPFPSAGPPLLLRLEGVIQPSAAAAQGTGFTVVSLGFTGERGDTRRFLGVTRARTFGGDQFLDGKDVLAIVAPFTPNLIVTGPDGVIARLRDAAPGTRLRVEGLVHRGSRIYLLRRVEPLAGSS